MFWKYENEVMQEAMLKKNSISRYDFLFKGLRELMEELRIRTRNATDGDRSNLDRDIHVLCNTDEDHHHRYHMHQHRKNVSYVEIYLKNVSELVLTRLNYNFDLLLPEKSRQWFKWIQDALHWLEPRIKHVLGFDTSCVLKCGFETFQNEPEKRKQCNNVLSGLYRDLKGKAYTNRENEWKMSDGTDMITYIFNRHSENGQMMASEFRMAVYELMAPVKASPITINSIFREIRIHGPVTVRVKKPTSAPVVPRKTVRKYDTGMEKSSGYKQVKPKVKHSVPSNNPYSVIHVEDEEDTQDVPTHGAWKQGPPKVNKKFDRENVEAALGYGSIEGAYGETESTDDDVENEDVDTGDVDTEIEEGSGENEDLTGMLQMPAARVRANWTSKDPSGFVTENLFRRLILENSNVYFYIEFVKTLYTHIEVLGNIIAHGDKFMDGLKVRVVPLAEIEKIDTYEKKYTTELARLCLVSNYNKWWDHFSPINAIHIMNMRNMMCDNVVYMSHIPEKGDIDKIRRIFLCNNDIRDPDALEYYEYDIQFDDLNFGISLENIGRYKIKGGVPMVRIGTEYSPFFYSFTEKVNLDPQDEPTAPFGWGGDKERFKKLPNTITSDILKEIKKITKIEILKKSHQIRLNCKIYDREFIKIKFHEGTSVNVPIDPTLVLKSCTWTIDGKEIEEKFSLSSLEKCMWNFNLTKWEFRRDTYCVQRNAKSLHSAGDLHNALKSNDISHAAQYLSDICTQVRSPDLKDISRNLKTWCVPDRIEKIESDMLHTECTHLQMVANECHRKIQIYIQRISKWHIIQNEMNHTLRRAYPCLVTIFYKVLECMRNLNIPLDKSSMLLPISTIFKNTHVEKSQEKGKNEVAQVEVVVTLKFVLPLTVQEFKTSTMMEKIKLALANVAGNDVKSTDVIVTKTSAETGLRIPKGVTLPDDEKEKEDMIKGYRVDQRKNARNVLVHVNINTKNSVAGNVKANLSKDNIIEQLQSIQILKTKEEFKMEEEATVIYSKQVTPKNDHHDEELKKPYIDLISECLIDNMDIKKMKSQKSDLREIEIYVTRANFQIMGDENIDIKKIEGGGLQLQEMRINTEQFEDIHENNSGTFLNFLIFDLMRVVIGMSKDLLLTKNDAIVEEYKTMSQEASQIIRQYTNNRRLPDELKKHFKIHESDIFLRYNVSNKFDILDFLQKQWLLCLNKLIIINLDGGGDESSEEVRFNLWKNYVINFLEKLTDEHISAQLNVLFLYIDKSAINRMIKGLDNLTRSNIQGSVDLNDYEIVSGQTSLGWISSTIARVNEDDIKDPIYFGQEDSKIYKSILGLQTQSIDVSFAAAEMTTKNTFHMNDNGHIKKCISTYLTTDDIQYPSLYAHRVDLWLNIILTTMHLQLSLFYCSEATTETEAGTDTVRESRSWEVPDLAKFFDKINDHCSEKWDSSDVIVRYAALSHVKQKSDFADNQLVEILKCAEQYENFMRNYYDQNTETHTMELKKRDDMKVYGNLNNLLYRKGVIFKWDLHFILSTIVKDYVYPIFTQDKLHLNLIRNTFNAAINNQPVAVLTSENYLLEKKMNPTPDEILGHNHMHYIIRLCKIWYGLPQCTYYSSDNGTAIRDFRFMYTPEMVNSEFHKNYIC